MSTIPGHPTRTFTADFVLRPRNAHRADRLPMATSSATLAPHHAFCTANLAQGAPPVISSTSRELMLMLELFIMLTP